MVDEAVRWLKDRPDQKQPFFLTVWTHEPHAPIDSGSKFMDPYKDIEDAGIRQHHGNITQLDHAFGVLMKALDDPRETTEMSARHPEKFDELKRAIIEQDKEVLAEGPGWWNRDGAPE